MDEYYPYGGQYSTTWKRSARHMEPGFAEGDAQQHARLIVDMRGVYLEPAENVVKA
jgi:hypothetical protein